MMTATMGDIMVDKSISGSTSYDTENPNLHTLKLSVNLDEVGMYIDK